MRQSVEIELEGLNFLVVGDYIEETKEYLDEDPGKSYPKEGGYLEDYSIYLGDEDVTELVVDPYKFKDLISRAEELING